jgi:hypothetical protein
MNIGEESDPIEVPLPAHPDETPVTEPAEPAAEPEPDEVPA